MGNIESEQDYVAETNRLAAEFLRDYTSEQLAVIAAQHVIYREIIEARSEHLQEALKAAERVSSIRGGMVYVERNRAEKAITLGAAAAHLAVMAFSSQRQRSAAEKLHQQKREKHALMASEWDQRKVANPKLSRSRFAADVHEKYCVEKEQVLKVLRKQRPTNPTRKNNG